MAYTFKKFRKQTKKIIPMVRKGVRSAAKAYLGVARSGAVKSYRKTGVISSTAIAKSLSNLNRKVGASSEYKNLEENHTLGDPDVTLRQFYSVQASANKSTVSTNLVAGVNGYFLNQITNPTRGDGLGNFDGKKYSVESIQWKGSLYNMSHDATVNMYIVQYMDEDNDPFQMNEFLRVDNNNEYSVMSKRNNDFKGYKVICQRNIKFSAGASLRKDFNIICRPRRITRIFEGDDNVHDCKYFCIIVASGDVSTRTTNIHYIGNTKMRFIN